MFIEGGTKSVALPACWKCPFAVAAVHWAGNLKQANLQSQINNQRKM
jgi:hypothetical protein